MRIILSVLSLFICLGLSAQKQTTGPEKGHLIIAGGALRDPEVFAKFIELAGGDQSHIVVIPTAGGYEVTDERVDELVTSWKARGAAKVTVLHTTDPKEANKEAFAGVLRFRSICSTYLTEAVSLEVVLLVQLFKALI
jgi:cyanophycinase